MYPFIQQSKHEPKLVKNNVVISTIPKTFCIYTVYNIGSHNMNKAAIIHVYDSGKAADSVVCVTVC